MSDYIHGEDLRATQPDRWAKNGDRVKFLGKHGYDQERRNAELKLMIGYTYRVEDLRVGRSDSQVKLHGIDGWWNYVMFEWLDKPPSEPAVLMPKNKGYKPQVGDTVLLALKIKAHQNGEYHLTPVNFKASERSHLYVEDSKEPLHVLHRLFRPGDLVKFSELMNDDDPDKFYRCGRLIHFDEVTRTWLIRDNSSSVTMGNIVERHIPQIKHDE